MNEKTILVAAEITYEGYRKHSKGKSIVTGAAIPPFAELKVEIQDTWKAAAVALLESSIVERIEGL